MTGEELHQAGAPLEELEAEGEQLRAKIQEQVAEFGFTPPRAEKSKRLTGSIYQFTLSHGLTTDVKDAEVERIREACPQDLFGRLFRAVTRYKLADGATMVLAAHLPPDAPRNLRQMFARAVVTKETAPRLRIEELKAAVAT